MRADDLTLHQLLNVNKDEGLLHLGGDRVLLIDIASLGMLRKELLDSIGHGAAKAILTRFGYSQGWRNALSLKESISWDTPEEWRKGGGRIHQISGVVKVVPIKNTRSFEARWYNSYEAEQHLHHIGLSKEPVCWSLIGYASGYMSAVMGKKIIFIEQSCKGQGSGFCHVIGKPLEEWDARSQKVQNYYSHQNLFETLGQVAEKLRETEKRLVEKSELLKERENSDREFLVRDKKMKNLLETAKHVAPVPTTVLILGESGTGKERLAKYIHNNSKRKKGPFVAINCGALPENLLESELFGYRKGAFTGADGDHSGIFEQAEGGTLFLDEIGETTPKTQVRLLRAIQEREIQRLGDGKKRSIDVRILAATNRDLTQMITEKTFREDLYYRLNVVVLKIPPLRERREDIIPLARMFQAEFSEKYEKNLMDLDPFLADFLVSSRWSGNIRELQNAIESAVVLTKGKKITLRDLPSYVKTEDYTKPSSERPVRKIEDEILDAIAHALKSMKGSTQAEIANALGITPATLWRRKKSLGPSRD